MNFEINPKLDLVIEKTTDVSPELIWKAWTEPEHLKKWFCPRPWQTVECKIDLRQGGMFFTTMRGPEGQEFSGTSCYLEIIPNRKLVWTSALQTDYRPSPVSPGGHDLPFTAVILLEPHGSGTRYKAIAMHRDEAGRTAHEQMGFVDGWGAAFAQLVEHVKSL